MPRVGASRRSTRRRSAARTRSRRRPAKRQVTFGECPNGIGGARPRQVIHRASTKIHLVHGDRGACLAASPRSAGRKDAALSSSPPTHYKVGQHVCGIQGETTVTRGQPLFRLLGLDGAEYLLVIES